MISSILVQISALLLLQIVSATDSTLDCPPATFCYAIDESASISDVEFRQQTNALSTITRDFDTLSPNSTYAAVGFAKTASVIQEPTKNLMTFLTSLSTNTRSGGGTALGSGLLACSKLLSTMPDPRVIVLITDGMDRKDPLGLDVDDDIKASGITIATIGVGDDVDADELKMLATSEDLYRSIDNYADFSDSIAKIVRLLCKAVPSLSASPSVSPSMHLSPSETPPSKPSASPVASISVPAPTTSLPPTKKTCTEVQCGQCGKKLECYVNSGSDDFDKAVSKVIHSKAKFCTWKRRFTECGQICGPTTTVNCIYGKSVSSSRGKRSKRGSYLCSSKKGYGKRVYMSSVASYKVCIKGDVTTVRCMMRSCPYIGKALRCDIAC